MSNQIFREALNFNGVSIKSDVGIISGMLSSHWWQYIWSEQFGILCVSTVTKKEKHSWKGPNVRAYFLIVSDLQHIYNFCISWHQKSALSQAHWTNLQVAAGVSPAQLWVLQLSTLASRHVWHGASSYFSIPEPTVHGRPLVRWLQRLKSAWSKHQDLSPSMGTKWIMQPVSLAIGTVIMLHIWYQQLRLQF